MNGFGLSRERFALLFSVMLVAAAGNTAMQSLLPAIGRELGVADIWVAVAFSLVGGALGGDGAVWARRADRRGRRALMRLGLYGFIVSMLICGVALAAGLAGLAGPMLVFTIFMLGRTFYGAFGSASPPAVQAYIAARTEGRGADQRSRRPRLLVRARHDHRPGDRAALHLPAARPVGAAVRIRRDRRGRCSPSSRFACRTIRRAARPGAGSSPIPRSAAAAPRSRRRRTFLPRWLARSARPALAHDRHRRRPRPRNPARRDRLPRHRPAESAARPRPAMDRDRADGGRRRDPVRAMVADPAIGAHPAPARPLGLARSPPPDSAITGLAQASTR